MLRTKLSPGLNGFQPQMVLTPPVLFDEKIDVSIVIPLLNEEENLVLLYEGIKEALDGLPEKNFEIIFIDDGSKDKTFEILKSLRARDPRIWIIRFRRNFGQTAAFSAGFHLAQGEVIITMDGDLQNDPQDIGLLLSKVAEGYDVVSGWRIRRQDKLITRRLPSIVANSLISRVTGVRLHDYGCSLKAYRADVVKNIELYGEMHRFIPALASWVGVQVAEVPVNHRARRFGKSKYGLGRIVRVILDLITVKFLLDYATRPLQIFGLWGIISFIIGTVLGAYLSIQRLFFNMPLANRPIVLLVVLLIMLGVQLIIMGLLGELMVRTYHEAQGKPIYMIREVVEPEAPVKQVQETPAVHAPEPEEG
jgi:glycosyltransferase involved in cell wall biosynthesis